MIMTSLQNLIHCRTQRRQKCAARPRGKLLCCVRRIDAAFLLVTAVFVSAAPARAHVFTMTETMAILRSDGSYQIDMTIDVDALALGVPSSADSQQVAAALSAMNPDEFAKAADQARNTILRRVRIRFDGEKSTPLVSFPRGDWAPTGENPIPTVLGITARLEGRMPPGAREFTFGASRAFAAVTLTLFDEKAPVAARFVLGAGEDSPPHRIGEYSADSSIPATRYLTLGFEHILPDGLDHMLFVLGLFLLSTRLKPLLWQVTAFTLAHSVTLALAMYGVVTLPSSVVEPLIAVSIAYVAVENICTSKLKPWRPAVVFGFGLLHGLGFAGALSKLGLPREDFAIGLALFNVGVELGQLAVVALAFGVVGWACKRSWYRSVIVIPSSTAIALTGLYWAAQRTFGW